MVHERKKKWYQCPSSKGQYIPEPIAFPRDACPLSTYDSLS